MGGRQSIRSLSVYQKSVRLSEVCPSIRSLSANQKSVRQSEVCPSIRSLSVYQKYVRLSEVCPSTGSLSVYQKSVRLSEVCPSIRSLSVYQKSVRLSEVCPSIRSLSVYHKSVRLSEVCPSIRSLSMFLHVNKYVANGTTNYTNLVVLLSTHWQTISQVKINVGNADGYFFIITIRVSSTVFWTLVLFPCSQAYRAIHPTCFVHPSGRYQR